MKNRYLSLFLFLVFGVFAFTGCEEIAQVQTPIDFAQIRVANFNNSCNADIQQVYDVYIYPVGQPSAIPEVRGGLGYGMVTPWIDNLRTNREAGLTYKVQVRPAGDVQNRTLIDKEITLKPGDRYTLWIFKFDDYASAPAAAEFISDKPEATVEPTKAYFRFINSEADAGTLSLKVGDPLIGNPVGGTSVDYRKHTSYEGYTSTTVDTTLTFFVVDNNANVVGRIAGVALESGTYKTITWGGNCPGRYKPQEDPTVARPDSHHVRILDDAGDGSDETKIVPQTLRYFFVNALIPPASDSLKNVYGYDQLGVVINNDNRYNFAPLSPYSASPSTGTTGEGVINVIPTATLLTDAVNVKGYVYNTAAPNIRGSLLFDYRAGPRADIKTDELVVFVVSDTVRTKYVPGAKHPLDSSGGQYVFQIPDQPKAGQATFVVANMLVNKLPTTANKIEFYWNDNLYDDGPGNWNRKVSHTLDVPAGPMNLKVRVNDSDAEVYTFPQFNAEPGGIYLILVVGRRLSQTPQDAPRIMVVRTNPQ
jgi:hypothetical protein